jgi:hypothetical protein
MYREKTCRYIFAEQVLRPQTVLGVDCPDIPPRIGIYHVWMLLFCTI